MGLLRKKTAKALSRGDHLRKCGAFAVSVFMYTIIRFMKWIIANCAVNVNRKIQSKFQTFEIPDVNSSRKFQMTIPAVNSKDRRTGFRLTQGKKFAWKAAVQPNVFHLTQGNKAV